MEPNKSSNDSAAFSLDVSTDGLWLTVNPAFNGEKTAEVEELVTQIRSLGYDISKSAIVAAVGEAQESGAKVKLADKIDIQEPEVQVVVERDRMEAFLQIQAPKGARAVSVDEVLEKIKAAGVVFGIDSDAVLRAVEHIGVKTVVARGKVAENGKNAEVRYLVSVDAKGHPQELSDGRVDYKSLNLFINVDEGAALAEKVAATSGENGYDVLGRELPAKKGKDVSLPVGKNTRIEGDRLIANQAGNVLLVNGKINVVPVIEIKQDVDLSTGNIVFSGNVIVGGSVQQGFSIQAGGNVEVRGAVCGGTVEGKNITVCHGIQGMNSGIIKAVENVNARYVENGVVQAGGDVTVNDAILHSRVSAGGRIGVEGRRGVVTGGHLMAGGEIALHTAGTQLAPVTILEVGIDPVVKDEYRRIRDENQQMSQMLEQTQKALVILKAVDPAKLPAEKHDMLLRLTKTQFQLVGQLETIRNRMMQIELLFEDIRTGKVKIDDVIYPGVKIIIGALVRPIREPIKHSSFYVEDGEIKIGPY